MAKIKKASAKRTLLTWEPPVFLMVLAILAMALAVRLVFAHGLFFSESLTIAGDAKSLYTFDSTGLDPGLGNVTYGNEFYNELNTLPNESWPVALVVGLLYTAFGVNDLMSVLPALLASLLIGFLLYILGAQMFDEATGLLAAFLWAILPLSVFLSINLLPIVPLAALNLLAVALFFWASNKASWLAYILAVLVAAVGLFLDWTFFLPTAIFMVLYTVPRWQLLNLRIIGIALGLLVLLGLLLPGVGVATAELYSLNLLLFDNFLILPLFVISLVFVASLKPALPLNFLLLWLGVKAVFIFVFSPYILQKPLLQTIGFSGYWLDLIPPVLILISFHFARRFESIQIKRIVLGVALVSTLGLICLLPLPELPAALVTIFRISVGVAFLCIFVYLAFWKRGKPFRSAFLLSALLTSLTLASLSITNDYVSSYVYAVEDAKEVRAALASWDGDTSVFVGDEFVYERFLYLGGFQNPQPLDGDDSAYVYLLNANRPAEVPEGAYVLVSSQFLNFVLGITPPNWEIIREFSHSSQQNLILYYITPEES